MEDSFNRKMDDAVDLEAVLKKLPQDIRQRILDIATGAAITQEAEEKKSA